MIQYSILLPQRDAVETVAYRLTELCAVLAGLGAPFELLCIDDHSSPPQRAWLKRLLAENPCFRVLELRQTSGLDAALAAGISRSRGAVLVGVEASDRYLFEDIPRLTERLARADVVWGCRRGNRLGKWWRGIRHLPRTLLSGSLVRDPDCVFWAARREVFHRFEFERGWHALLPELATERGFRVAELHVAHRWHARRNALHHSNALLSLWPFTRDTGSFVPSDAVELSTDDTDTHRFEAIRFDPPQPLSAPAPTQPETPRDRHRTS
jgi:dolichol-phosphate mannosyltransferase